MTGLIEYITQNYFLILFFVVLILLAVIGYFAEKATNLQAGKRSGEETDKLELNDKTQKKFDPQAEESLDKKESTIEITDKNEETERKIENVLEEGNDILQINENSNSEYQKRFDPQTGELLNKEESIIEMTDKDNGTKQKTENVLEEETDFSQKNEPEDQKDIFENEEFNQFNLEFDSLLPKKEIIDTDLLSDIDSLELDKTQKIDLSEVPDLDNIDLPKIKQMTEEEDIWKF